MGIMAMTLNCIWWWDSSSGNPSLQLLPGPIWSGIVVFFGFPSIVQIELFKDYLYLTRILETINCKLFVLRIVTWSSNCLLRFIISYLKPCDCANKWLLLNRNNYLKSYNYKY